MITKLKAEDKRLAVVLMSTNGEITENTICEASREIHVKHGMNSQHVSTTSQGYQTVLLFELYNDTACLKDRICYRLRKLLTTIRMKLNGNKIVVRVIVEGETDRFPMHGAFH